MPYCRMLLAVAMGVGSLVYASERRISRKALRAVDPESIVSDLSAVIAERGVDELDRAVANRDESISLAAAWQRVVRAGRGVQQAQVRLSTTESSRFLGVVEGRVGARPPELWDKCFAWGTREPKRRVTFGIPLDEISVSTSLGSVRRVGEQYEARFGKSAVTIDVDRRYIPPDRVSYVEDRGTAFVALYSWPPLSYWLFAVDIESERIIWKAKVAALGRPRGA